MMHWLSAVSKRLGLRRERRPLRRGRRPRLGLERLEDRTTPAVQSIAPNAPIITDAKVGSGTFALAVTFTEAMDTTATPTLAFTPAIASTLTFATGAWSAGNTVYTATYNVADANVAATGVDVAVSGTQQAGGGTGDGSVADVFNVDTQNPTVTNVAVNDATITDADVGTPFTVAVTFSEAMNAAVNPAITFSPTVGDTLTFQSGAWSAGNTVFTTTYTRSDSGIKVDDVDVVVAGGQDANGNVHTAGFTKADAFDVDLQNPTIVSVVPNFTTVSDAQVGTGKFKLTVTFSEDMNQSVNPTVTFPTAGEDPGASLSGASGAWTGPRTFVVTYNVNDLNVRIPNIDVRVSGGQDLNGNATTASTTANVFSIDTQAPTVTSVTPRFTTIIRGHESKQFTLTVVFSEAMNTAVNPTLTFPGSDVSPVLTFSSGVWSSPTTYVAVYNQKAADVTVRNITVQVAGPQDAGGNALATSPTFANNFSIDRQAPTVVSVTPSFPTISDAKAGQTFTLTIVYSEPMSTTSKPLVTFPGGLSSTLQFVSRSWTNSTTHVVTYLVSDSGVAYADRTVVVRLARDAAQNRQAADGTFHNVFSIDTGNPEVQGITLLDPKSSTLPAVRFQVTFREAVTGVDVADFAALGISGATVTQVTPASGSVYVVTVSKNGGTGQLRLQVKDDNTIHDTAGNALGGPTTTDGEFTSDVAYDLGGTA